MFTFSDAAVIYNYCLASIYICSDYSNVLLLQHLLFLLLRYLKSLNISEIVYWQRQDQENKHASDYSWL